MFTILVANLFMFMYICSIHPTSPHGPNVIHLKKDQTFHIFTDRLLHFKNTNFNRKIETFIPSEKLIRLTVLMVFNVHAAQ